jgi:hypothetical protein
MSFCVLFRHYVKEYMNSPKSLKHYTTIKVKQKHLFKYSKFHPPCLGLLHTVRPCEFLDLELAPSVLQWQTLDKYICNFSLFVPCKIHDGRAKYLFRFLFGNYYYYHFSWETEFLVACRPWTKINVSWLLVVLCTLKIKTMINVRKLHYQIMERYTSGYYPQITDPLRGPQVWVRGMARPRYQSYPVPGGIAGPPCLRGL